MADTSSNGGIQSIQKISKSSPYIKTVVITQLKSIHFRNSVFIQKNQFQEDG